MQVHRGMTPEELEEAAGEALKQLRLLRNLPRRVLAERAGISESALKNLELGQGTTLKTFMAVVRALGRSEWLNTLAPVITVSPMTVTQRVTTRQRASKTNRMGKTQP